MHAPGQIPFAPCYFCNLLITIKLGYRMSPHTTGNHSGSATTIRVIEDSQLGSIFGAHIYARHICSMVLYKPLEPGHFGALGGASVVCTTMAGTASPLTHARVLRKICSEAVTATCS